MPYQEYRISSSNALSLYVRDYAATTVNAITTNDDVVLCLGGLTRNSKDFAKLALRLSQRGYRVIAPDYRGRGLSAYDPEWMNYNPKVYLDDIRQILTALDVHKVAVIGTSLGGLLAMAMGVSQPSTLCGVLINDVCPEIPTAGLKPVIKYMQDTTPLTSWDHAVRKIQKTFPDFPASSPEDWLEIAHNTYRPRDDGQLEYDWDPHIVRAIIATAGRNVQDLWPMFAALGPLPVGIIRGELSPFISDDSWQRMAQMIPTAKRVIIEGVGHAPSLNERQSTKLIDQWLLGCFSKN